MSTSPSDPEGGTGPEDSPATKPKSGARGHDHGDNEGEDEGGAPKEGDYSGLNENQKPVD